MKDNAQLAGLVDPEPPQEIAPGMTIEEIRAIYFDADALKEPAFRLYQLNSDGHRYYYRYDEKGEPQFYPSVTTLLKQVMPTSPALLEWMIANGKEGSTEKRDLAAAYGTFMHIQFEHLIINRRYDFDAVPVELLAYMERENLPEKVFSEWLPKIRKDVLAFAQFVKDYNVKPLAVEIGLYHPKYHYAGCIDLPCIMTDPKTGNTFTAIVDFKSGRKGFYEEHELQLHLYAYMWNDIYPETPVTRVFNFSPKDWRKSPTYNLKDQTDSPNVKKLPHLLALAAIEDEKRDNTLTIVRGVLDLDKGKISDNILNLSLAELIKTKAAEKDAPEQAAKVPAITQEEIDRAEKALGISTNAPEISTNAPEISTNAPEISTKGHKRAVNRTKDAANEAPKKAVETPETEETKDHKRAVKATKEPEPINSPSEPEKPVKTEIPGKLPDDGATDKLPWEPEPAKPAGPTPEQMAEQAAKDNLLNAEIEL